MNESNLGVRSFFVMNILHFSNKKCPIGAVMRNLSYEARLRCLSRPFFHFGPSISGLPPPRLSMPHIKENTGPVAGPFAQDCLEKPA